LKCAEDSSGSDDFNGFTEKKRSDRKVPYRNGSQVQQVSQPASAKSKEDDAGANACNDGSAESRYEARREAHSPAGNCRSQRIGKEKAGGRAEQLCDAAGPLGAEYRQPCGAFGKVQEHRRKTGNWTESHANKDDGKRLERDGHGREEEWDGYMRAHGNKRSSGNAETDATWQGLVEWPGALHQAGMRRNKGLHSQILSHLTALE
jgi:hypothetical protein